jgi:hippurate hydrolase
MASEDFAELSARVPGAYFFIGQSGPAPHHPEFVFDTDIIPVGAAIFADLAKHRTSVSLNSHHLT